MTVANLPLNLRNISFIIWVALNRLRIQCSSDPHPFDPRYISGDAFRSLGDHIYEGQTDFDPTRVRAKDIVFVSLNVIDTYFEHIHPRIQHPYRLISHNGDTNITGKYVRYIDRKILVWWTQNCLVKHPKVRPIPIGIENLSYYNHGIPAFLTEKRTKKQPKILHGFSVSTNRKIRSKVQKILEQTPAAQSVPSRLNSREYFDVLRHYMFVASPPGNGEDCHRTWEAMYIDVVPIVMRNSFMSQFEKLKLPVWVLDDWNELRTYSNADLATKYKSIKNKSNKSALYFEHWAHKITKTYNKYDA